MKKHYNQVLRMILLCTGLCLVGLGGSIFLFSRMGADPFNLLAQGLSHIFGFQVGTGSILLQATSFVLLMLMWREKINVGTFLGTFLIGSSLNMWTGLLNPVLENANFITRLCCVFFAPFLIGFSIAVIQIANMGMVPNDIMPLFLYKLQNRFQFRTIRIFYDSVFLVCGVLLGGTLGIGTVLSALLTGPIIQYSLKLLQPVQRLFENTGHLHISHPTQNDNALV